ncbi:hypothetical protein NX722_28480 [Endozoicomonas gorgoniicola]|uniref:Uncharacterized protein n=1 Tax=Endozoicomonas gorgoniicola TaxID=1234144 RepID=A0ABT3N4E4_9GAMM|nr:hypothetical protein [Endozoicomonas gorgoniicola]MCW7556504.1 hypothetical protein [Endozoicomonas gorgoniicola]
MSMYPSVGGALINAFNPGLFDSYKSAGWQRLASALADKYPELDLPVSEVPSFDNDRLRRVDWATQAGMTAGVLRHQLRHVDYHLLKMRYTHDGNQIVTGNHRLMLSMTDNLRAALVEGWPVLRHELIRQRMIRASVLNNETRLQYMALRALRPDVVEKVFQAQGSEQQATVNNQQLEVKKAVVELITRAMIRAESVLESNELVKTEAF